MEIRQSKRVYIKFGQNDMRVLNRLIHEQVGDKTIGWILDNYSYVFEWYAGLFSIIRKMRGPQGITLDPDEYNALATLVSKAYNDPNETEKDAIKEIADAIDTQRNSWYE